MSSRIKHVVRNDQGREMYFSGSVLTFISNWKRSEQFRLGHWLVSLSKDDLERLGQLGELADQNDDAHLDLLQVAVFVIGAEEGEEQIIDGEDETMDKLSMAIDVVKLAVAMEKMARQGMLEIKMPLSIDPNEEMNVVANAEHVKQVYSRLRLN